MKNLAVILARSGSKGLKNKNIKLLDGKPLMAYSIESAKQSGIFDAIHVSTDSEEYKRIAEEFGAEEPFLRDEELAQDNITLRETVLGVLEQYEKIGKTFDNVMVLQPTSPLRDVKDVVKAYNLFIEKKAKAVISVCECDYPPVWCNTLTQDGNMESFIKEENIRPRQELPIYYRVNGAIYLYTTEYIKETDCIYTSSTYAYIMDKNRSVDIDDILDFKIAELYLEENRKNNG